jgi:hypothetical protein
LIYPLQRWLPEYEGMSDEEYEAAAISKAEELIPAFVDKVLDLYTLDGEIILSRLSLFVDSIASGNKTSDIIGTVIAQSITAVYSFDVSAVTSTLSFSTSATLQPGSWGYVYATDDWIWVADQGWRWVPDESNYVQDTVLLGFRLDGPSSSFSVFGSVPGNVLSQFSIDFYKDAETGKEYVRAATTLNFWWGMWWGFAEARNEDEETSITKNQVVILEIPDQDGGQTGNQLIERGSLVLGKTNEVS